RDVFAEARALALERATDSFASPPVAPVFESFALAPTPALSPRAARLFDVRWRFVLGRPADASQAYELRPIVELRACAPSSAHAQHRRKRRPMQNSRSHSAGWSVCTSAPCRL